MIFIYLSFPGKVFPALKYKLRELKPFQVYTNSFWLVSMKFHTKTNTTLLEFVFEFIFKGECCRRLSGCFPGSVVLGILKADEYNSIDVVSLFFQEIVDTISSISDSAPVTEMFSIYVNLTNGIRKRFHVWAGLTMRRRSCKDEWTTWKQ